MTTNITPSAPVPDDTDDFSDLNALLGQALAESAEEIAAKEARKRVAAGGLSAAERAADAARIAAWEARVEWTGQAMCALFEETYCPECSTAGASEFVGFFRRDLHRTLRASQRFVAVARNEAEASVLPRETYLNRRVVQMCEDCAPVRGWLLADARPWGGANHG